MPDKETLYEKIAGSLIAGALGDALGYEVEFDRWSTIRRRYGDGGIRELELHDGKAIISDDTQMTLFTLEGMIFGYRRAMTRGVAAPVESYIYEAYLAWLKTQTYGASGPKSLWEPVSELLKIPEMNHRRAPGNTCLSALQSGKMGTIGEPINHSKGCGGVMRTAPLGYVKCFGDAILNGAKAGAITHGHPMGFIPSGILSGIVDRIIYGEEKDLEKIVEDTMQAAEEIFADYAGEMSEFRKMMDKAVALSREELEDEPAIRSIGEGWVGDEALAVAVYSALKYRDDIKAALICATNHSGDSDSTAAIAGNIVGAYLGLSAIDPDWIRDVEMSEHMLKMADEIVRIALERS